MLLCGCAGIVSTHRIKWVENEPLRNPQTVQAVQNDNILLADGRRVSMPSGSVLTRFTEPVTSIELAETQANGEYEVFYKARSVIRCGLPYNAIIKLPLFSDETPKYTRRYLGRGKMEEPVR
jgi:hypothetical protein